MIIASTTRPTQRPDTSALQDGDIWVRTPDGYRELYEYGFWSRLILTGVNRENSQLPPSGGQDMHLAKRTASDLDAWWQDPAQGLLAEYTQTVDNPADEWQVVHALRQKFVSVTVISPGKNDPDWEEPNLALDHDIIIPEIIFNSIMYCTLKFARPIAGTVFVRK